MGPIQVGAREYFRILDPFPHPGYATVVISVLDVTKYYYYSKRVIST